MTRMQKWQSYRDEIAKQAAIGKSIAVDDNDIKRYKAEIDKINPAILSSNNEIAPSLQKGVSRVDLNEKEISIDIANMFLTINKAANTINQDKVESIFYAMKNDKILDKNNRFKNEKLLEDRDYAWFKTEAASYQVNEQNIDNEIKVELEKKYNNFSNTQQDHVVENVITFSKDSHKQASHYVFVISISVSLLMLIILVSLFITKVVLK